MCGLLGSAALKVAFTVSQAKPGTFEKPTWPPVTKYVRSRPSYGKREDCEQSRGLPAITHTLPPSPAPCQGGGELDTT